MFYGSYFYNPNTWFSGIILLFFLMAIAFMGYVLPFGQMRFWRILCSQSNIEEVFLSFIFFSHFFFVVLQFFIFFYLHFLSSNNPLRNSTNNKIPFFPFIIQKDFFGLIVVLCLYFLQTHFGISSLSHPDNALEACALLTPLHIVP